MIPCVCILLGWVEIMSKKRAFEACYFGVSNLAKLVRSSACLLQKDDGAVLNSKSLLTFQAFRFFPTIFSCFTSYGCSFSFFYLFVLPTISFKMSKSPLHVSAFQSFQLFGFCLLFFDLLYYYFRTLPE